MKDRAEGFRVKQGKGQGESGKWREERGRGGAGVMLQSREVDHVYGEGVKGAGGSEGGM